MEYPIPYAERRRFLLRLVVAAIFIVFGAVLAMRGVDLRAQTERFMTMIRDAGPVCFFVAMALLPALPVPMLAFLLTAGPAFRARLGMPAVLSLSLFALTVNFTLTYFLARCSFRPLLIHLLIRLGYRLPQVKEGDVTDLAVIARVTPGIPFFAQNYLLGLAGVPFGRYVLVSCIFSWGPAAGFVLFGDALLHGRAKMALCAGGLVVAAAMTAHLVRRHHATKLGNP